MKSQIFLLKANTFLHAYFTISSIFSIVFASLGTHVTIVDFGAFLTFFSFLFFKRCILIDIHQHIRKDLENLPYSAQDSFTRDVMKSIVDSIFNKKVADVQVDMAKKRYIQDSRLDILNNVEPFVIENEPIVMSDMLNRKIQYIAGNIVMGSYLMVKYNVTWFPVFMIAWLISTFPL